MSSNFPGINPLKYGGVRATNPPQQYFENRAPTPYDWEIYQLGDEWLDKSQSSPVWYKLVSKSRENNPDPAQRALWKPMTAQTINDLSGLTGDNGTEVFPSSNHTIQLEGTSGQISVTEDPANNKLVFALAGGGTAIDSLTPDSGTSPVVPNASGNVTMSGSGSIATVGGTNTLTTQLTGLTNHAVLVGAGTSTITKLTVGNTGELLVGATGADPAFAVSAEGDFAFTQSNPSSATNRKLVVSNADTANSASNAQFIASVGGTSSGDAHSLWSVSTAHSWALGPDTSENGVLKINYAASSSVTPSSGNNFFNLNSSGIRRLPSHPFFYASPSAPILNVTGDGTIYQVAFDNITQSQNQNLPTWGYDNSTYYFITPVDGVYQFTANVSCSNITSLHNGGAIFLYESGSSIISGDSINIGAIRNASFAANLNISFIKYYAAGSSIGIAIQVSGSTKTVGVLGATNTYFMGALIG